MYRPLKDKLNAVSIKFVPYTLKSDIGVYIDMLGQAFSKIRSHSSWMYPVFVDINKDKPIRIKNKGLKSLFHKYSITFAEPEIFGVYEFNIFLKPEVSLTILEAKAVVKYALNGFESAVLSIELIENRK